MENTRVLTEWSRSIYVLFGLVLLIGNFFFLQSEVWYGDFWHHAAIVHALAENPLAPKNPFVADAPFFMPYILYLYPVAFFSLLLKVEPYVTLAYFSFFNLLFLLFALARFSREFVRHPVAPALLLVLVLGCWGQTPYKFSSFFHAKVFFFVLSYPSTFAFALCLYALSICKEQLFDKEPCRFYQLICAVSGVVVVLVHPLTFVFFCCGILGLWRASEQRLTALRLQTNFILTAAPILAWCFWPFFPMLRVLGSSGFSADPFGVRPYQDVFSALGFVLFGFVLIVRDSFSARRNFLCGALLALISLYGYGFVTGQWNYGRTVAFAAFLAQVAIVQELVANNLIQTHFAKTLRFLAMAVVVVAGLKAAVWFSQVYRWSRERPHQAVEQMKRLAAHVPPGSLVLANSNESRRLPSFGIFPLVFDVPPFFGDEYESRSIDQASVFGGDTNPAQLCEILIRHDAKFILLSEADQARAPGLLSNMESLDAKRIDIGVASMSLLDLSRSALRCTALGLTQN